MDNPKTIEDRMSEFIDYHKNGDGECNTTVLCEYASRNALDTQSRYDLAFFFSVTYSVISAIVMLRNKEGLLNDVDGWIGKNKENLIFQSDRKYIRMGTRFDSILAYWKSNLTSSEKFINEVEVGGEYLNMKKAVEIVEGWKLFGRFSAYLFVEAFSNLMGYKVKNTAIPWKRGNTATSGMLNLLGFDIEANEFDKTGALSVDERYLDKALWYLVSRIERSGGGTSVSEIETSLCAYRKFYKGSRYNGYYLDRMLEEIETTRAIFPEITDEVLDIRETSFDWKYLGEKSGWNGIRKEKKRLYKEAGIIE